MIDDIREQCLSYIGRERVLADSMAPEPAMKLATLLDQPLGDRLRTTWHWAYFNPAIPERDVGHDGHERLGLFMPPAPFERRMWAAGTVEIIRPLAIGTPAHKRSRIADVAFKSGKSGDLCFVTVEHEIDQGGPALRETQTIVYRDRGLAVAPLRNAGDPIPGGYRVVPDTTLVAYSAITQNGHRIHWDRDFCRDVEGYPGLVVHGPLLATYLADTLIPEPSPCRYAYRATAPVFETSPIRIASVGDGARIERSDGAVAMEAHLGHVTRK
ncbi:MAG: acyl-CoA dehydrogenase [Silicimonas sp.]|nr:acyl-CoA dehydrogenase [Silicimonas sp.]